MSSGGKISKIVHWSYSVGMSREEVGTYGKVLGDRRRDQLASHHVNAATHTVNTNHAKIMRV